MSAVLRLAPAAVLLVLAVHQLAGTAHGRTLTATAPAPGPAPAEVDASVAGSSASTSGASYITPEQFPSAEQRLQVRCACTVGIRVVSA